MGRGATPTAGNAEDDLSLMLKDLEFLQRSVDKFDSQRFQIKSWTIASAAAILTYSFGSKNAAAALGGLVVVLFFAFLEVIYLEMQVGVIQRSNEVERLINLARQDPQAVSGYVFGIGQAFVGTFSFRTVPELVFKKGRIHIISFHFGLLAATLASAIGIATWS